MSGASRIVEVRAELEDRLLGLTQASRDECIKFITDAMEAQGRELADEKDWAARGWRAFDIAHDQAMANGGEAQSAKRALTAIRPVFAKLIEKECNVETWGLRGLLDLIDSILDPTPNPIRSE